MILEIATLDVRPGQEDAFEATFVEASAEYPRWKALLHHFYDPFSTVEHYERVI